MKNYVQPGDIVTLTAPAGGVVSGDGVMIGDLFGVAQHSAAAGLPFESAVAGVFDITKVASQAWTEGQLVYWDSVAGAATTTASDNKLIGKAVAAVGSGAGETIGRVRLN